MARKTGQERFHQEGQDLGVDLLDFWRWSASDLVGSIIRERLAEYIVARAVGIDTSGAPYQWETADLKTPSGVNVAVTSAAYVQGVHQTKESAALFLIRAARPQGGTAARRGVKSGGRSGVRVFALLCHRDKATIDPLNVRQWHFYVLPSAAFGSRRRSITLKSLAKLCGDGFSFDNLREAVERAAGQRP